MPHPNTMRLIRKYGDKFINGTLTQDDIIQLNEFGGKEFPRTAEHTPNEAIQDFIQTIAPCINSETLHNITHQFLEVGAKYNEGPNTFMRNSTVEKNLLAFEIANYPEKGREHLSTSPVTDQFKQEEISKLEEVIISKPIEFFTRAKDEAKAETIDWIKLREKAFAEAPHPPAQPSSQPPTYLEENLALLKKAIDSVATTEVKNKAQRVYDELESLKNNPAANELLLGQVAQKTRWLIQPDQKTGEEITPKEYRELAKQLPAKSWASSLGAVMATLGKAVALFFVAGAGLTGNRGKEVVSNLSSSIDVVNQNVTPQLSNFH
ncbi:hypothetical protein [Legionella quinlivanii]|uniref:hypothetical protein n=1 Tax=Legionella quinlivanii TaxID=45073 RepID=UPI002243A0D8|nr:hypothetical protein [Legionella quinlivanii]MCW8451643.1 hypothetical protein [Legionella quinlivanii]